MPKAPEFKDTKGSTWQVIAMHVCIGGRGKSLEIEAQCDDYPMTKTFYYWSDTDQFRNEDEYITDAQPTQGSFSKAIQALFSS
jgi:hypothetical protein